MEKEEITVKVENNPNPFQKKVHKALITGELPIIGSNTEILDSFSKERFKSILTRFNRCVVELGCGSSRHLIAQATITPDTVFLGIDLRFKRIYRSAEKTRKLGLNNLFFLRTNAKFLGELFLDESGKIQQRLLDGIYMHFPDPWGKSRWHKNRMFSQNFLNLASQILRENGWISFMTDHEGYFQDSLRLLNNNNNDFLIDHSVCNVNIEDVANPYFLSDFGLLFRSKGIPVNHFIARLINKSNRP
jgi:tRNA (guanine-N(7)-)-methyltransferase